MRPRARASGALDFLGSATREEVAQGLAAIGWSDVVVKSGISLRRLVYTTIDAHGEYCWAGLCSRRLCCPSLAERFTDVPRHPQAMEQNGQLSGHRHHRALLSILSSALAQSQSVPP
jgi:hypothetical protein